MAVPFSNTKLRVPKGFQNILECLAREVLRSQPDNIHEFAAAYFESLLRVRAETGHDPAVHGARLEDRNYNNEAYKKRPTDAHEPDQRVAAATTIQTQFRQQVAKEEVDTMRQEDAAIKIQSGFRGHMGREQVRQIKEGQDAKVEAEDIDIDLNCPDVKKAAIKIQAGFKGFKARKEALSAQNDNPEDISTDNAADKGDEVDEEVHRAATKIQAGYRGHSTRKQLKERTEEEPSGNEVDNQKDDDLQDIDLKDPDLSKAALKIQAGFRGLRSRKELQMKKQSQKQEVQEPAEEVIDIDLNDPDVKKSAILIQAGFKGLKARKNLRQKAEEKLQEEQKNIPEKEADADIDEPKTDDAALKIQAAYRGYATRKSLKKTPDNQDLETAEADDNNEPTDDAEEVVDIDLEDPEVEKATIKLQAGFKGFMARKQMMAQAEELRAKAAESSMEDQGRDDVEVSEDVTVDAEKVLEEDETTQNERDREKAVIKIQAGYRGMKVRGDLKAIHGSRNEDEEKEDEEEEAVEETGHEEDQD